MRETVQKEKITVLHTVRRSMDDFGMKCYNLTVKHLFTMTSRDSGVKKWKKLLARLK